MLHNYVHICMSGARVHNLSEALVIRFSQHTDALHTEVTSFASHDTC